MYRGLKKLNLKK